MTGGRLSYSNGKFLVVKEFSGIQSRMTTNNYVAYIGIDWGDRTHDIALYDCALGTWQKSIIQTRPQDLLN
jgi:hypothetical protein